MMTMSAYSNEAGPSCLSSVSAAPMRRRCRAQLSSNLDRKPVLELPMAIHHEDEDVESNRVDSLYCSFESDTEPASLFGADIVTPAASQRSIPLFLRPMASEMVRPPELALFP